MIKRIFLAALLLPLLAFGQSYPSPTFNNLTVQGTFTLTGGVPPASLAAQAANTVLANVTTLSASPTAVAMPSCSTANSALKYTSGTGWSCGATYALTSGTLAQFAATTSAQLAGIISDETGSGSAVFGTNPTIGTPTINTPTISGGTINNTPVGQSTPAVGSFTTLSATGLVTPSTTNGIKGTVAGDNAVAGSIGEYMCAQVTNGGSPTGCATNSSTVVPMTSTVIGNITTLTLTPGDWDVTGEAYFLSTGGTFAGTSLVAGIANSSAGSSNQTYQLLPNAGGGGGGPVGTYRYNVTTNTQIWLVGVAAFTSGTEAAYGSIKARRRR